MLVSTALHAALFLALLALPYAPSLKPTTPVLDVALVHVAAGTAARARSAPAAASASAAAERSAPASTPNAAASAPPRRAAPAAAAPAPDTAAAASMPKAPQAALPPPQVSAASRLAPPAGVDLSRVVAKLIRDVPPPQPARPQLVAPKLSAPTREQRMVNNELFAIAQRVGTADGTRSVAWTRRGEHYTATFRRLPAEGPMGIDQVVVDVRTERNGRRLSARLKMRRLAFSSYAQFVDHWNPDVWFHDDRIDGRFHANSDIQIEESFGPLPHFEGKVTTSGDVDQSDAWFGATRLHPRVFFGGLRTHVRRIELPRRYVPFPGGARPAASRIQRFAADTRIVFNADGSFSWRPLHAAEPVGTRKLPDAPFYILAAAGAELDVSGAVNGKVLVYSPAGIVIAGSLTYAADPARGRRSDDYVGLVSDADVEIAGPETTGAGDLSVEAAIYAKGRFAVDDLGAGPRATLHLYGSIAAGTITATEPRFRTDLHFDRRFRNLRPPQFPLTDRYAAPVWNGRWRAEPASSPQDAVNAASNGGITAAAGH